MAQQKKRSKKISQGVHGGGGKVKLTRLQLALLGKGPADAAARRMQHETRNAAPLVAVGKPEGRRK